MFTLPLGSDSRLPEALRSEHGLAQRPLRQGTPCCLVAFRFGARKRREAEARTPAAKIAAAAARPPRRKHPSDPVGFERPRPRAETLSYQQRREAVWMSEPARSLLVTAIGQRSFDPLDSEEIEHCLRWLDGQPEVAGIPADTIRAALASVGPGEPFSLLPEEPKPS
jgi:hypothetical protein